MKAIVCTKYGPPEELRLEEIQRPAPGEGQVLVEVQAASVTYSNLMLVTGTPFAGRLMGAGLFKPNTKIPGSDVAGRVVEVGRQVKNFKPGNEVFGDLSNCGRGSFAEYVAAPENALALKPSNISFEEAACVPEAALVALQALRDAGQVHKGQHVLIYGASGGIGTFAVQIAKSFEAEVTGVCSTGSLALVHSLGADHLIDYTREDFTRNGKIYDLVIATAGYRSITDYRRALGPKGIYVCTGGKMAQIFQAMLLGPLMSKSGGKKLGGLLVEPNKDLVFVKELIEAGKIRPIIDRSYPLSEAGEALRYYGQGHTRGKVVIRVEHGGN